MRDHLKQPGRRAVEPPEGVKVRDVIWISEARLSRTPEGAAVCPVMPELVVEVISGANTRTERPETRRLSFAGGALEVWTCDDRERVSFYDAANPMPASKLAPSFPASIA